MTTEIRQIVFQQTELCAAIHDYKKRRAEPLPPGSIIGVTCGDGPDPTATLTIRNDSTNGVIIVTFNAEEIAAALILFCINRRIPLPAKAGKKLVRYGDSFALM